MTTDIAIVLAILAIAIVLFITERMRPDVVALLVLVSLALTGLVTPTEALSGFANLAVITVWAVLILSGGLARTGVASVLGRQVLRFAGHSEARLIAIIMITVGVLSGFMNDIGVAALMLPVVVDIAHRLSMPPSRLLMPLAFAALLGGLNTLIGTPPNILVSEVLRQYGEEPFKMFDYTPTGIVVMTAGIAFMVLIGRHLLPSRDIKESATGGPAEAGAMYDLHERIFIIRVPEGSRLAGRTLIESRLGAALELHVMGIIRGGQTQLAPDPAAVLQPGDRLIVEGGPDRWAELQTASEQLIIEDEKVSIEYLSSAEIGFAEVRLPPGSPLLGQTLEQLGFRHRFGVIVLTIRRADDLVRTEVDETPLQQADVLLVQGTHDQLKSLQSKEDLVVSRIDPSEAARVSREHRLEERLILVRVPEGSSLDGKSLIESRLGDAYGVGVIGIVRGGTPNGRANGDWHGSTQLMPDPEERLKAGDLLLVKGRLEALQTFEGLQSLEIEEGGLGGAEAADGGVALTPDQLESDQVGLVEVILSPRTTLTGKSLREIDFRDKYGLSVLAIWREGRPYRSHLRDMALRQGDALLLHGLRDKLRVLGRDPDFLVLTEEAQEAPRLRKAPLALLVMVAVLAPVMLGLLPIAITAVMGVVLMILTGCLTMEEAYQSIEWKAIFLIAGMLPLGIAMEQTGAASFLAEGMVTLVGAYGPIAVLAGLFILAALASQVMPNPAVAVLLAPIAYNTASDMGISPYPLMMAVAVSASAAFLSPVGHSANILVMGPGGYRFSDYTKVGIPLTLVVLVIVLVAVPIFWPF